MAKQVLNKENPECCFHCINRSENRGTDGTCPARPGNAELGTKSAHPDAVMLLSLGGNINLLPLTLSFLHFSALNHAAAVAAAHAGAQPGSKPASSKAKRFWGVEGSDVMDKRICAFDKRAGLSLLCSPLWWLPTCWGQTLVPWLTAARADDGVEVINGQRANSCSVQMQEFEMWFSFTEE